MKPGIRFWEKSRSKVSSASRISTMDRYRSLRLAVVAGICLPPCCVNRKLLVDLLGLPDLRYRDRLVRGMSVRGQPGPEPDRGHAAGPGGLGAVGAEVIDAGPRRSGDAPGGVAGRLSQPVSRVRAPGGQPASGVDRDPGVGAERVRGDRDVEGHGVDRR